MESSASYQFTWLVPERVLLAELGGVANLDDVENYNQKVLNLLEANQAPVHIIVDCTQLDRIPVNLTQVLSRMTHLHDSKLGYVAAFGLNRFVYFIASAVFSLSKTQLHVTITREDAITYIKQLDDTVNWNGTHDS